MENHKTKERHNHICGESNAPNPMMRKKINPTCLDNMLFLWRQRSMREHTQRQAHRQTTQMKSGKAQIRKTPVNSADYPWPLGNDLKINPPPFDVCGSSTHGRMFENFLNLFKSLMAGFFQVLE